MRSIPDTDETLAEALCAWLEGGEAAPTPGQSLAAAAWAALAEEPMAGLDAAALAITLGETTSDDERDARFAHASANAQLEAAEDFLNLASDPAPFQIVELAHRLLDPDSNVVALRPRPQRSVQPQAFRLRAAASSQQDQAVLCRSDSGIWTLEVFVASRGEGEEATLLLSVDPDYRATYEGLRAKVFVTIEGEERVLVDADVRGGELYAGISLRGLDLFARDAISVVFSPDDGAR